MYTCRWERMLVLAGFLLLWTHLIAMPVLADCPGNVAVNPGFEHGFSMRGGAPEVSVANGWHPFWKEGPRQEEGYNHRPEFKPEDAARFGYERVREGNWGQKMFTTYATHHAGILQQIGVPQGSVVSLSAWAQAWSSTEDNPDRSKGGKYYLSVGIDPTGGTDFTSGNVVWSERNTTLDQWVQLKVQARAQAGTVTVFLRGDVEWPVKHNDAYFDDVCVTYVPPTPRPTPIPTDTPIPTNTPTLTPSPTIEPTATSSPTPVLGTLSVSVFEDLNGDGRRDPQEPPLSGAGLVLRDEEDTIIESYTTDDSGQPHTFAVEPGNYTVIEMDPDGYVSSSPNQQAVTVVAGSQVDVSFADHLQPTATPTETIEPSATVVSPTMTEGPEEATPRPTNVPPMPFPEAGGGLWQSLYSVSGILVSVLALMLPVGLYLLRNHR
ncbi:MAG: SdrD B-like domain-containing protein [Chloroflexota bacterium]|nr:SdrD B-like domain-containing protein [Chloroflexota bacterium]